MFNFFNPLLLLILYFGVIAQSDDVTKAPELYAGNYLIVAPKSIRPRLPYAVSVNILKQGSPVTVTLRIVDEKNASLAQVQQNVGPGEPKTVKFEQVPNSLVDGVSYRLHAKGEIDGKVLFEQLHSLNFEKKSFSTFIQTDKAIYKPGSTVHFRIVTVYPDLKPYLGSASIKISDPNQNVIQNYANVTFDKGVIGKKDAMKLILSDEPPLGDWKIKVDIDGQITEKSFSVEKYVLPKFEVIVKPPPFMTLEDDLVVTISAKYTYGKGVTGPVWLQAEHSYSYRSDIKPLNKSLELDKNGEAVVRFSNAALKEANLVSTYGYGSIKLTATVTEGLTGIQRNGTGEVTAYRDRYKIQINKPAETFQPGLDYVISIAVVDQDSKPLLPKEDHSINVTVTFTHAYVSPPANATEWVTNKETVTNRILRLDKDGTIAYPLKTIPEAVTMRINAKYGNKNPIMASESVEGSKSPTKSYLQLTTEQTTVKAGEKIVFKAKTTSAVPWLTAQVMTRGYMVYSKNIAVTNNQAEITIPTSNEMAPSSRLIVYGVRPENKEIIVGSMDIKVSGLMKNNVSISCDPKRAEPGNKVTFTVKASPDSYVGLLAVDQSVLLLKSGNDITKDMVESEIAQYDTNPSMRWWGRGRSKRSICWRCGWWGISGKDAATIFDNSGVFVLTDAYLYSEPIPPNMMHVDQIVAYNEDGEGEMFYIAGGLGGRNSEADLVVKTRSKFPETFLWLDLTASRADGTATYTAEVPDTITSWITSAFAVHENDGLGVAPETSKLEVFRPFFIRLNLPYSVKRGEKLALQVLLFNYSPNDEKITITLEANENSKFKLVNKPGNVTSTNQRSVTVPGNGGTNVVFFPLVPTEVGDLKLLVKAVGQKFGDAVEQVLIVEAEGFSIYRNKPFVVDLISGQPWSQTVKLDVLPDVIPGSQRATVSFVGDIMGPILENIEKLIQMPYGCGEQNMLNFVPNIVVARYLKATNRLTPALSEKTKRYMEAGYQRELTYQRDDFSYSAFGKSDKAGSTWLTAFVASSFHEAKPYIYIDDTKLASSLEFLKKQQKENGAFEEKGEVHHKDMQGGSGGGGAPLSAYIFIALLKNDVKNPTAQTYLERAVDKLSTDPYSMAILTYALHLANSPKKDEAFTLLQKLAKEKDGLKYWEQTVVKNEFKEPAWYDRSPPANIEMTSYALLTYILRGDTSNAVPLVRWLVSQQNSLGGYSSTQDTVLALQALGAYAEKPYSPDVSSKLNIKSGDFERTLIVSKENAIVQQSVEIKNFNQPIELKATGKGTSFGQVSWHYNVPKLPLDQPFICEKDVKQTKDSEVFVNLCCKYNLEGRSNMALMEIKSPSGYVIDQEKLNLLTKVKDVQRVDLEDGDSKANIYFNSIGHEQICLNVTNQRVFSVADQKASIIKLMDYYAPSKQIRFDYAVEKKVELNEICGGDCWKGEKAVKRKRA